MYKKTFDGMLFNFKNDKTKVKKFVVDVQKEDYNISID